MRKINNYKIYIILGVATLGFLTCESTGLTSGITFETYIFDEDYYTILKDGTEYINFQYGIPYYNIFWSAGDVYHFFFPTDAFSTITTNTVFNNNIFEENKGPQIVKSTADSVEITATLKKNISLDIVFLKKTTITFSNTNHGGNDASLDKDILDPLTAKKFILSNHSTDFSFQEFYHREVVINNETKDAYIAWILFPKVINNKDLVMFFEIISY